MEALKAKIRRAKQTTGLTCQVMPPAAVSFRSMMPFKLFCDEKE